MKVFHQLCGVVKLFEKHKKREKKGKKGKKKVKKLYNTDKREVAHEINACSD